MKPLRVEILWDRGPDHNELVRYEGWEAEGIVRGFLYFGEIKQVLEDMCACPWGDAMHHDDPENFAKLNKARALLKEIEKEEAGHA